MTTTNYTLTLTLATTDADGEPPIDATEVQSCLCRCGHELTELGVTLCRELGIRSAALQVKRVEDSDLADVFDAKDQDAGSSWPVRTTGSRS